MKVFIDVSTPGNGKTYEFQLDSNMTVSQVKRKLIDEITEMENGNITLLHDKTMLCDTNTRLQLNLSDTLKNAGVKSGHSLMLI